MHASMQDAVALLKTEPGSINNDATAGGSGDATEVDCAYVDVRGFHSLKVVITFTTTLAASQTLSFAANLQDATASDGTGVADYGTALASTEVATATGAGTAELDFDVRDAKQFVRAQVTPDLSASGTDTANFTVTYVLAGAVGNPATKSLI